MKHNGKSVARTVRCNPLAQLHKDAPQQTRSTVNDDKPVTRAVADGALGGAVGFAASLAWSRYALAETVARGALKNMAGVRDQHWLRSHPIGRGEGVPGFA